MAMHDLVLVVAAGVLGAVVGVTLSDAVSVEKKYDGLMPISIKLVKQDKHEKKDK